MPLPKIQRSDKENRRLMLEATAAALLLLRRQRLPVSLSLSQLQRLDALAAQVELELAPRIARSIQIGQSAGSMSMMRPVAVGAGSAVTAAVLSAKFADSWRRRVMKALIGGADNPAAVAAGALRSRLDTIAVTESAKAYNETRQTIADRIKPPPNSVLVKEWDAELDACPYCAAEHGTVVLAADNFPGGIPGAVHPRCQCIAQYSLVSRLEYYALIA